MAKIIPLPRMAFAALVIFTLLLTGCAAPEAGAPSGKLDVVATTNIVGDVVANIGGEHISLVVLVPPGADEHGYQSAPQDVVKVAQADLVFMNGAGLEQFIEKLMQEAASGTGGDKLVTVSQGVQLLEGPGHMDEGEAPHAGEEDAHEEDGDPHVWMDPNNVLLWVDNIEKALSAADPSHSADYRQNAEAYRQQLRELDAWIGEQVSQVPPERRKLVTDHTIFTYFASRYGFEQVGAVVPGYSTMTSPSAQELAALETAIRDLGVPAVFVGNTVNPALAKQVAQDTDTRLIPILTGSLAEEGAGATYIEYMRYNVGQIVEGLK